MRFSVLAALAVSMLAAPVAAQATRYQDGGGRAWDAIPSENGLVLATRGTTVHLGRDCKAVSSRLGDGRWQRSDDGFTIVFGNERIGFSGQQLALGDASACRG